MVKVGATLPVPHLCQRVLWQKHGLRVRMKVSDCSPWPHHRVTWMLHLFSEVSVVLSSKAVLLFLSTSHISSFVCPAQVHDGEVTHWAGPQHPRTLATLSGAQGLVVSLLPGGSGRCRFSGQAGPHGSQGCVGLGTSSCVLLHSQVCCAGLGGSCTAPSVV